MTKTSAKGRDHRRSVLGMGLAPSLRGADRKEYEAPKIKLQPMSDLNLMIALGYGDTPQCDLPEDWRERRNG